MDFGISGGEPLIRSDLFDIVAHAKSRGMSVGVASNGAKLSEIAAQRLFDLDLNRLQISLDGLPEAHDTLRCWPGLFERALRSIQTARQAGLRVHICCTINRLNVGQLPAFVQRLTELDVQRLNFSRYVSTGRGTDALDLTKSEWHEVIHSTNDLKDLYRGRLEIVSHLAQQILVDGEVADMPGFIGCQAGRGQGCVTANGTVLACVLFLFRLGTSENCRSRASGVRLRSFKSCAIGSTSKVNVGAALSGLVAEAAVRSLTPRPAILSRLILAAGCPIRVWPVAFTTNPTEGAVAQTTTFDPQQVVTRYFELIRELRSGQADAVDKLVDLWDEDGVFEFVGASPVTGTFKGRNAIHVLYKNRLAACGMPLHLNGHGISTTSAEAAPEVALGIVDTHVNRMRTVASRRTMAASRRATTAEDTQRVAVGWTTVIGTQNSRGLEVNGNHAFIFKNGKISSLKVSVAPKPNETAGLSLQGLAVEDIGRLSLAAWAVV